MIVLLRILAIVFAVALVLTVCLSFASFEYLPLLFVSFAVELFLIGALLILSGNSKQPADEKPTDALPPSRPDEPCMPAEHVEQPATPAHNDESSSACACCVSAEIIPCRRCGILAVVSWRTVEKHYETHESVSLDSLRARGVVGEGIGRIQIVVDTDVSLALNVEADIISDADAARIINCGGSVKKYR